MKDFEEVSSYITDELNCLELKLESNEDEYVTYKCDPDNRLIGGALKKAYDKKMKEKISKLSTDQLRSYLENGYLDVDGIRFENEWLKVERVFRDKYAGDERYGCASTMTASVMLNTVIDEKLEIQGMSREVTNRI